jgi:hypothetical protein
MALRRFLPAVVCRFRVQDAFRVQDGTGQRLAYFYWWDDLTARYQADVLTEAEARRLAEDFANLSEL